MIELQSMHFIQSIHFKSQLIIGAQYEILHEI